uniref:Adenosine deaminase-like protein n=1 Tax=Anopheles epiroticus TaxID=199890 RepID=A0A182PCB9_9DIPT
MAGDFSGCTARKKNRAQSIEYNPVKTDGSGENSKQPTNPLTTRSGLRVYKIVILGDGGVGKSAVTLQFVSHSFLDYHDPTIEDSYQQQAVIDGEAALLDILDTAGQVEFTAMRDQYMRCGEGFIICYSVTDRHSFQEASEYRKLIARVRLTEDIPLVLVANKLDLQSQRKVTTEEGKTLAKQFGCPFYETSAALRHYIDEAFFSLTPPKYHRYQSELHAHLNGSLSNSTLAELRELKYGKEDPGGTDDCFYKILNGESLTLEECFKKFQYAHDLTERREALERATERVIEDFANDNVIYLELRTTPKCTAHMSKREYLTTVLDVIRKMSKSERNIIVKLLPSIDRSKGVQEAMENVNLAIELSVTYPDTIVAIDLSGKPFGTAFSDFVPALEKAREHGFRLALHCGESEDEQEVKQMFALGVDRIGHGTFIEGENLAFAQKHNIPFECCLTSNVKCKTVPSYEDHHIAKLLKLKQPVCVCTDDFGVFQTSLSQEVQICATTFNLAKEEIVQMQRNAVVYSFASEQEKKELSSQIDQFSKTIKEK